MDITVVVSRDIDGDARKAAVEDAFAELCNERGGLNVLMIPHLYHLPTDSGIWDTLSSLAGRLVVVTWHHPRPVESILGTHGLKAVALLSFGAFETAEQCYAELVRLLALQVGHTDVAGTTTAIHESLSPRWYPVLDLSRCESCGHCMQFCIFDVYGYNEAGRVTAVSPDSCKPGCPACSRICPKGAIIFPCYRKDDAIAGAPGTLMSPDAAARRMLYVRTKQPCPVCNRIPQVSQIRLQTEESNVCEECGVPLAVTPRSALHSSQDAIDDIDLLINDLENVTRRRP